MIENYDEQRNIGGQVEKNESILKRIREAILSSPEAIENEFERTGVTFKQPSGNTWFNCYQSRLTILSGLIMLAQRILPKEETDSMSEKLVLAGVEMERVRGEQQDKLARPSKDDKENLLRKLEIL